MRQVAAESHESTKGPLSPAGDTFTAQLDNWETSA
jgi:hypothetical protein